MFAGECLRKLYHIFPLIKLLSLLAFYLRYSSQLTLCEQGVGGICLYFPLPHEISLPCDGDSLGQSTCASHLIPLIYHHVSLRNRRISLSATVAPQFTPANNNKVKPGANVGDYWQINSGLLITTPRCGLPKSPKHLFFPGLASQTSPMQLKEKAPQKQFDLHFHNRRLITVARQHRALVCMVFVRCNYV